MFDDYLTKASSIGGPSSDLGPWDELAIYLSTDPVCSDDPKSPINLLKWWKDHCDSYPKLSAMAMDYLSIPGELNLCSIVTLLIQQSVSVVS